MIPLFALLCLGIPLVRSAPTASPSFTGGSFQCEFNKGPLEGREVENAVSVAGPHASELNERQSTWSPPASMVQALNDVWNHEMSTYSNPLGFKNYGYDQVMAGKGNINFCVRWESTLSVTADQRAKVEKAVQRSFNKWIAALAGFDGFPYSSVNVKVVGWAVSNAALLQGSTSGIDVYTGYVGEGAPQCDPRCGRFFHQNGDYSQCPGGAAKHYDLSLWLTEGFQGGAGGDWGQRMGRDYFMANVDTDNIHIFLHELGHTFALDDFYDWTPVGQTNFIMLAGSATQITEFDKWMARDWWRHLKSRYGL